MERSGDNGACVLAWGAVLVIAISLVLGIGWPWLERVTALEREIESLDDQMIRYHRLLRTLPALQAELEQVRNNKDVEDFFFDAKTPALAGAELQRVVKKMVNSAGGRVTSTQLLPSSEDEQPPQVRVRAQIQAKTEVLLDVLYQIEKARPFLFVEQLSVRAHSQRRPLARSTRARERSRAAARRRDRQGQLRVRLDVLGYALGETP